MDTLPYSNGKKGYEKPVAGQRTRDLFKWALVGLIALAIMYTAFSVWVSVYFQQYFVKHELASSKLVSEVRDNSSVTGTVPEIPAQTSQSRFGDERQETIKQLPPSSLYCSGSLKRDRTCNFQNLYYYPKLDTFFAVKTDKSQFFNVPENRSEGLVDLTSSEDRPEHLFFFDEIDQETLKNTCVYHVPRKTYMINRYRYSNIMHVIHDDLLPLYFLIKQHGKVVPGGDLDTDNNIFFLDGFGEEPYGDVFRSLSDYPLRFRKEFFEKKDCVIRFEDAVVGQSKMSVWYDYGHTEYEHPVRWHQVYGTAIREAASFLKRRLKISPPKNQTESKGDAVILSRSQNRKILNEVELQSRIASVFNMNVHFVRMEDHSFREQIEIVQNAKLAMGMHGSLLIMAMFMSPGSTLVEFFPYAVPSEDYTPYKTMCELPGMGITYRAWENKHIENNEMNMDYLETGLTEQQQQEVFASTRVPKFLCCGSTQWSFRIYQNTIVELNEVVALIADAQQHSQKVISPPVVEVYPARITRNTIRCIAKYEEDGSIPSLNVHWRWPWNYGSVDSFEIWNSMTKSIQRSRLTRFNLKSPDLRNTLQIEIKIRTVRNGIRGPFSKVRTCKLS